MSASREKTKEYPIGEKESQLTYEQSADGKRKYRLVKDSKGDLFIGTYAGSYPCVIRRYDTKDSDVIKYIRDVEALQTKKKNLHENFIRYFGQVQVGHHT